VRVPPPLSPLRHALRRGSPKRLRRGGGRRETLVHLPALIAAAGVALAVVQWAMGRPLWLDEEFLAVSLRDRGITDYFEPLWLGQTAPFGWLVLQRVTVLMFGTGERAIRLVPMLFGVATIGTAVWIGGRWMTVAAASMLVLLCAFAQWLTYHFFEMKPYSADAFLALLMPAVAAWSVATKRPAMFWIVAAVAQWFGNGALYVTPLCALMLAAILLRREGWRSAFRFSVFGLVWLGSFALNYALILRHAASYAFFYRFWAGAFPPPQAGIVGTVQWFLVQLAGFGMKPGSASFGSALWLAAFAGFIAGAASGRSLALFCASVPIAAILLTALRLVPFYERITLWVVPALYVGVALLADIALQAGRPSGRPKSIRLAAVVSLIVAALLSGDIAVRGALDGVGRARSASDNHALDDRAAVRWLNAQKRPGDVWMTTHYGVPAVWWYAGIDQERIIEVRQQPEGSGCRNDALTAAVADAPRVLLYLGFRFDDVPPGFDDLLVGRLSQLGSITHYRPFANASQALVIDRRAPVIAPTTLTQLARPAAASPPNIDGCFAVRNAEIPTYVQ
jgi:hypothetical protein